MWLHSDRIRDPRPGFPSPGPTWRVHDRGSRLAGLCVANTSTWVAVKELKLGYQNSKTILVTMYPYHGNLSSVP